MAKKYRVNIDYGVKIAGKHFPVDTVIEEQPPKKDDDGNVLEPGNAAELAEFVKKGFVVEEKPPEEIAPAAAEEAVEEASAEESGARGRNRGR